VEEEREERERREERGRKTSDFNAFLIPLLLLFPNRG
jgi:hypothetical protein